MMSWICPNCGESLKALVPNNLEQTTTSTSGSKNSKSVACENNHQFDIAKEGYINLLLANQKNSKHPGDNKDMVVARRDFLNEGHYTPLVSNLADILLNHYLTENISEEIIICDAGCGEGYYLSEISKRLNDKSIQLHSYGIDISKPAIQKASKRMKSNMSDYHHFAVASSYKIPLKTDSQDATIQVFAPSNEDEIHRILKADGIWIKVVPAQKHLFELKELVYDTPQLHSQEEVNIENWETLEKDTLEFNIELNTLASRLNLLMMTPFYWSISESKKEFLLDNLKSVTASFQVIVLKNYE